MLTYADVGAVVRYGRNLPDDIPVTHISARSPRDGYRGTTEFGWYVWAGLDGRYVARNMFLDGTTFRDGPSVERKPFGYDAQVGVALAWPNARLGFTYIQRSREFDGQVGNDQFGPAHAVARVLTARMLHANDRCPRSPSRIDRRGNRPPRLRQHLQQGEQRRSGPRARRWKFRSAPT